PGGRTAPHRGAGGEGGPRRRQDAAADPGGADVGLRPRLPVARLRSVADFQPVAQVATFDFSLAIGPQVAAKSLSELVAWVKANPSQGSYGTPAAGTLPHFFAVKFARAAGLDVRHVGYRGSAAAMTDLVGGQIPMVVTTTSDVLEQHKAGSVRVLATSDRERSPFLPGVPTFREAGYDIEGSGWYAIYAPAGTPAEVVARLNGAIVAGVRTPATKERLLAFGLVPTGTSAA